MNINRFALAANYGKAMPKNGYLTEQEGHTILLALPAFSSQLEFSTDRASTLIVVWPS